MINEVVIPKLGQTMEEASIETWFRKEGDAVKKGDVLLEINTDKAALEVESYYTGTVKKILYPEGTTLPINAIIAFIGDPNDVVTEEMIRKAMATAKGAAEGKAPAAPAVATHEPEALAAPEPQAAAPPPTGRLFASPRARRVARDRKVPLPILRGTGPNGRILERDVLAYADRVAKLRVSPTALEIAHERGIDITRLRGSGIDGRIMKEDVEAAPAAPAPRPMLAGQRVPLTAMRRVVAQRMALSKATIPHFYLTMDADMTEAVRLRGELAARLGRKVSFNDLFLRACTLAFAKVPEMNVAWADGALLYRGEVNIGLAVALDQGLIVPVVRNCERKTLREVADATEALVERARNKRLTPDAYEGGCLTISNLGMFGVETVAPIINPGEVAILGIGRIGPRPVVIENGIFIRQMATMVLACDHRIVDGAIGARFLLAVKEAIEAPEALL